jgi:hypothetical protein
MSKRRLLVAAVLAALFTTIAVPGPASGLTAGTAPMILEFEFAYLGLPPLPSSAAPFIVDSLACADGSVSTSTAVEAGAACSLHADGQLYPGSGCYVATGVMQGEFRTTDGSQVYFQAELIWAPQALVITGQARRPWETNWSGSVYFVGEGQPIGVPQPGAICTGGPGPTYVTAEGALVYTVED